MAGRRFPTAIFLFAFFGWAFDFYDLVLLGFLKDAVARDLHLSRAAESWLLGAGLGASGVGGLVAGALADRVGKRAVLSGTVAVYSLGSLICGLAPTGAVFFAGRIVQGIGVGGEWAIGHGMLAESVAPESRGRAAAALQSGEPVGVALAALVGYLVLPRVGWRMVLVGSSATALLAVAARASVHLPAARAAIRPYLQEVRQAFRTDGLPRRFVAAWLLGVFKLGTYWSCYTWLPSFLSTGMHQSIGRSLTWIVTAQLGQLVGMMTFGVVSDRLGRRPAFAAYSLLTALAVGALALRWQTLLHHPPLFWAVMLGLGIGSGCTAGFGALLAELYPTDVRGAAMGATYNLARSAQLMAPVVVAAAVARAGLGGGLAVPCVLALATAGWVWVLPETRGIALPALDPAAAAGRLDPPGVSLRR
ncbi:MAG TPA: MFS transporter [Polyangia bacterium]|nr:MFS transporter [Polyangia bacterium]HVY37380.1 MFS transporter [Polyangia bacterium]